MTMNQTTLKRGLVLALTTLAALSVQAQSVLNTGTPSGGLIGADSIDAVDWMAESFTLSAPTTIGSIMAYVNSTVADAGLGYTIALYASTGPAGEVVPAIDFNADKQGQLYQFTATYKDGGGWIGQSGLNWALGAGTYFVAIETDGNGVQGLVLPTGVSTLPGAVAFYAGGRGYDSDPSVASDAFGLQVTAVPEPASFGLMALGLAAGAVVVRRRRA